jgi:tetratricopeptide (TPR) repeat protein
MLAPPYHAAYAVLTATLISLPAPAAAQTTQYTSPRGVTYVSLSDTGTVARADSALAAEPTDIERILTLGLAQSGIRQYREAIATFTRGLELAPGNALLYRWRGHRYLSVRELDRARGDLERGLTLDSAIYGLYYHLGIVRYVTGEFAAAAAAFAAALPIAPDSGERAASLDWSWMSLSRAGRHAEARALLERITDSLPAGSAYTQRIRLYRGAIGPDQVITPTDTGDIAVATLSYGVGNWYLVRGDTARAREWFERAIASGGWPAFGFIAAEAEFKRLR